MLQRQTEIKFSDHDDLYDILVPADSKYRQLNELIDFNSLRADLEKNYSEDMGRGAKDPVMLFKYLILKAMHPASDRELVERSYTDMAYKYFLGLMPEDDVIDPSLLTVFRRKRMKDLDLINLLIKSSLDKAKTLGLISSKRIIIDATHTLSVFRSYAPSEAISHRSHELMKVLSESVSNKDMLSSMPKEPMTKKERTTDNMVEFAKDLLDWVDGLGIIITDGIQSRMEYLKEALDDIAARAMVCADPDARKGHKSPHKPFTGYKIHISETEEGFITAATVTSGERGDGGELPALVKATKENGVDDIDGVIADSAYGSKDNMESCDEQDIRLFAPVRASVIGFRDEDDGFFYNKDADMVSCPAGELSVRKCFHKGSKKRKENDTTVYYFDIEKMQAVPIKRGMLQAWSKIQDLRHTYPLG